MTASDVFIAGETGDQGGSLFKVALIGPGGRATFEASAQVAENRQANYDPYNITHMPTSLYAYKNTDGRRFSINARLISRNGEEAKMNMRVIDLCRTWLLPDFGGTGATPPILKVRAYNNKNINNRTVVLKSYSLSFPDDVDYIFEGEEPLPVITMLQLEVDEIYSAEQITALAWKLNISPDGDMVTGGQESSISRTVNFGPGPRTLVTDTGAPPINGIAGALSNQPATALGVLAGALTRNVGTAVLNSSAVREVTSNLPPALGSIFVGGANTLINTIGTGIATTTSAATQPVQPSDLPPPNIIRPGV